jgi:hypothetical protein
MRKSWGVAIGAAAVALAALTPGVALAQPTPPTPNGDTITTFTIGPTGVLEISAPVGPVNLTSGLTTPVTPGGTITANLGTVTVTDLRSALDAGWDAQVASTHFTTGAGSPAETIPAADLGYDPTATLATLFGTYASLVGTAITAADPGLSAIPATVVTAVGADGDNQASWNPVITVDVPASAVLGTYSGTITHSVIAT